MTRTERPSADEASPVFSEPWEAQAFGLAVHLAKGGMLSWTEWTEALSRELHTARERGEADDGSRYYHHWLAALEALMTSKGLVTPDELAARKQAWTEAYLHTPHGRPVELPRSS